MNKVAEYEKFKVETLSTIFKLVQPNMFMAKLDIKDVYCSIPIKKEHQKLIKFKHKDKLFKFTALSSGYKEGPRKFTKVLKRKEKVF